MAGGWEGPFPVLYAHQQKGPTPTETQILGN